VLVSEFMLQQTGVERVRAAYGAFLRRFPSLRSLAGAALPEVLEAWKGLGYNRRALNLWRAAGIIAGKHGGRVPRTVEELAALPGVGRPTAGAVMAYAYDARVAFVETNVRRVIIHFFFPRASAVTDAQIMAAVLRTLPRGGSREWYDALMDYGTMLRGTAGDPNRRWAGYRKQGAFSGSLRQVRGLVLKALLASAQLDLEGLSSATGVADGRLRTAVRQLADEGFLLQTRAGWRISPGGPRR
jgi:A/G-specific adenine glycosylase